MNTYQIYLKLHINLPDFEDKVKTLSLKEAVEYWYKYFNFDLSKSYISENIIKA